MPEFKIFWKRTSTRRGMNLIQARNEEEAQLFAEESLVQWEEEYQSEHDVSTDFIIIEDTD